MQFPKLIFLIIILNLLKAEEFDTLSYVQKFDIAVHNFKDGRFRLAESGFKSILKNEKNYNDPAAQLLLAKSQYRQGKLVEALRSGKSLYNAYMNSPFQIHVSTFLGDISMSRGNFTRAIQYYLSIRPQINDSLQAVELDNRILCCIGNGNKPDKIEGLFFRERDKINKSILNFSRAYTAWKEGDEFDLNSALEGINPKLLSDVFLEPYYRLIDETNQSIVSQTTFAVILPLSGFEKEKGESYLLGLAIYLSNHTGQSSIRFKIYDSRGDGIKCSEIYSASTRYYWHFGTHFRKKYFSTWWVSQFNTNFSPEIWHHRFARICRPSFLPFTFRKNNCTTNGSNNGERIWI